MTRRRIVTVICSGNICRSPMAQALLKAHLAARGLDHIEVRSAGTHALEGHVALAEAAAAVAALGVDVSAHRGQQLDIGTARESDLILCATGEHREHVLAWWPELRETKVRLFNEPIAGDAPVDVEDPFGWDEEVFRLAARVIDQAMEAWADIFAEQWGAEPG
jgi:protein-tyrosine phosphatase